MRELREFLGWAFLVLVSAGALGLIAYRLYLG